MRYIHRRNTMEWDRWLDPAKRLFSNDPVPFLTIDMALLMRHRGVYRNAVAYWHVTLHLRRRGEAP